MKSKWFLFSEKTIQSKSQKIYQNGFLMIFFSIGTHSMQGWTATTKHGVTRKRSTKKLKHPGNLFRMFFCQFWKSFKISFYIEHMQSSATDWNYWFRFLVSLRVINCKIQVCLLFWWEIEVFLQQKLKKKMFIIMLICFVNKPVICQFS